MSGRCFWCKSRPAIERDHTPPVSWYAATADRPSDAALPHVPSCRDCNQVWRDDAQQALLEMLFDRRVDRSTSAREIRERMIRSLGRGDAPSRAFQERPTRVATSDTGEIVLRKALTPDDVVRNLNVHRRVLSGLAHWQLDFSGRWQDSVLVFESRNHDFTDDEQASAQVSRLVNELSQASRNIVQQEIFEFRVAFVGDMHDMSIWRLTFYQTIDLIGIVGRPGDMRRWFEML